MSASVKIVVPVKRVPNPDDAVRVPADGASLGLSPSSKTGINGFCDLALEAALRLRGKHGGGEIVVVSVGPRGTEEVLRHGLSRGADRAVHVVVEEGVDSSVVAELLAAAIAKETPHLVVMGKSASDDDASQVGQRVAQLLGWPDAFAAISIDVTGDLSTATFRCESDGGELTLNMDLPAVVIVDVRIVDEAKLPSLPNILKAKKKELKAVTPAELGVEITPRVTRGRYLALPERGGCTMVDSPAALLDALKSTRGVDLVGQGGAA